MGILIAIDGLDASGKETQAKRLSERLSADGYAVRMISFPRYGEKSAAAAELYLSGALGAHAGDTNAYAASAFFSIDRYISYRTDWKREMEQPGTVVIANRYTTANAVHQLSKLPREQWEGFLDWLLDFEFQKLGLPCPDLTVYLEMKIAVSHRLLDARTAETGQAQDIHEADLDYLSACYEAAHYAAARLSWQTIRCCEEDALRSREAIGDDVYQAVCPLLNGMKH